MIKNKSILSLFFVGVVALSSVGFSIWQVGSSNIESSVDTSFGAIDNTDFGNSIYYIKGTEQIPTLFSIVESTGQTNSYIAKKDFSIEIKINPYFVEQLFKVDSNATFQLSIQYESDSNINYFGKGYLNVDNSFKAKLKKEESIYLNSTLNIYDTKKVSNKNLYTHSVTASFNITNESEKSLYSISSYYASNSYVNFVITLDSNMNKDFIEKYKTLNFLYLTNLRGVI